MNVPVVSEHQRGFLKEKGIHATGIELSSWRVDCSGRGKIFELRVDWAWNFNSSSENLNLFWNQVSTLLWSFYSQLRTDRASVEWFTWRDKPSPERRGLSALSQVINIRLIRKLGITTLLMIWDLGAFLLTSFCKLTFFFLLDMWEVRDFPCVNVFPILSRMILCRRPFSVPFMSIIWDWEELIR